MSGGGVEFEQPDDATVVPSVEADSSHEELFEQRNQHTSRTENSLSLFNNISDFLDSTVNPLLHVASPLLLLSVQLRTSASHPDVDRLRQQVVSYIRHFESRAQSAGIARQAVMIARYALCAMIDESILNTPWGSRSAWSNSTLLVIFHGESYGGEKFFLILDRLRNDFSRHLDLIEMMYVCLTLGFAGRYEIETGGLSRLAEIQEDLYRRIQSQRNWSTGELAPHWRTDPKSRERIKRPMGVWIPFLIGFTLILGTVVFVDLRLGVAALPLRTQLQRIGLNTAPPPPPPRSLAQKPVALRAEHLSLKILLAPEQRRNKLKVIERKNGEQLVRINTTGMFSSGSSQVEAGDVALIQKVGAALNRLKGRVVVVGHTDSVPIHTAKFKNNIVLSKARAESVLRILAGEMDNSARLRAIGVGASQPLTKSTGKRASRALNRRVGIIYIPAT